MEKRAEMSDIREHIKEEVVYTPKTWMDTNIQFGATFEFGSFTQPNDAPKAQK